MSGENAVQDGRGGGGSPGCTSPKDAEGGETPAERRQGILDGVGCKPLWSSASPLGTEKRGRGGGSGAGTGGPAGPASAYIQSEAKPLPRPLALGIVRGLCCRPVLGPERERSPGAPDGRCSTVRPAEGPRITARELARRPAPSHPGRRNPSEAASIRAPSCPGFP